MPAKIKNTAGFKDVVKAIRGNVRQLDETQFSSADVQVICEKYGNVIIDLLKMTQRPIKSQTKDVVLHVFEDAEKAAATLFSERIAYAISHCRGLSRRATSCKKNASGSGKDRKGDEVEVGRQWK